MNDPRMPALLTSSGRPGFYFRVLQEGEVGAGDEIVKMGEPKERMTVAEINALLYSSNHARNQLERALRIERFRTDGARRLKRWRRAKRLPQGVVTRAWRRQQLRIRLHRDFGRLR